MAKSVDRMCEKYEMKLRAGRILGRVDGDRAAQLASVRRAAQRMADRRTAVAAVLSTAGIYSIWWPYYYSFSLKVGRLVERIGSADVLRLEARMQLEVWVARGLVRAVLEAIGREVFDLDLTGPIEPIVETPGPT
jgi:hypothetical protein